MSKFENFTKAMEKIAAAQELLSRGPASYYVTEMTGAYEYLMDKFAPFKDGDKVMLKERPDPMPSGWSGSAHFLVRGALATVKEIECGPKGFRVDVIFDDESWIREDWAAKTKEVVPTEPESRHMFGFSDSAFVKV
jgi:hypothetical protein